MMEAVLYDWRLSGMSMSARLVESRDFDESATQGFIRQLADDMAAKHDIDSGHVAIVKDGVCINKLEVGRL